MSVRLVAFEILRSGSMTPLREVDRAAYDADLDARDRGLLRRLIGTEVRRRGTLRALLRHFARGKPDRDLAAHLHLGFVQLFFLDQIPDHAAVGETVAAVMETLGEKKGRYANAVLREAIRARQAGQIGDPRRDLVLRELHLAEPVFHDPAEHPLLWAEDALSLPVALYKRWSKRYGDERARALAQAALEEQDLSLRVSHEPGARESIAAELAAIDVETRPGRHARTLLARGAATELVLHSPAFERGAISVQGESALRAAELVDARAGEQILELCAAPGGKTAVLAESGAQLLACDIDERRLERVRGTLARVPHVSTVELRANDGAQGLGEQAFDGVLLDVPCSNTGVLAKRPCARWRFNPPTMKALGQLQERLLTEAAACVKPGGRLVYATCSIEPEENQRRVAGFLARDASFVLEQELDALPDPRGELGPVDGGYAALLRRR